MCTSPMLKRHAHQGQGTACMQVKGYKESSLKKKNNPKPNTPHQSSPSPCFCEDLYYVKVADKPFEQTVLSLKRSQTVCSPLLVGGWHYFFSTAERQCFLKNELQNGRIANTCLSTNCFVCLRRKVFIWRSIAPAQASSETTHSQMQLSSHSSSWVSMSTSSSLASSEINWALSQCSSPPRNWHSQACCKCSTTSHPSCCHLHLIKHVLFLTAYLAFMHH